MNDRARRCESSVVVGTEDPFAAEHLRLVLLAYDIHVGIVRHDALPMAMGIVEILVLSVEHARVIQVLDDLRDSQTRADWRCANCSEEVPGNFELCWNCGAVRRELQELRHETRESSPADAAIGTGNQASQVIAVPI